MKILRTGSRSIKPHHAVDKSGESIPTVSIDYAFLNDEQDVGEDACGMRIPAFKDRKTGIIQARASQVRETTNMPLSG